MVKHIVFFKLEENAEGKSKIELADVITSYSIHYTKLYDFIVTFLILQMNFEVLWRYFAWSNQTLAVFTLWSITVYLARKNKFYWISLFPAIFMTAVSVTYIMIAPEGFHLSSTISYSVGLGVAAAVTLLFWSKKSLRQPVLNV